MHLASMVHGTGREREEHDHRLHQQHQHQQYHAQHHHQPLQQPHTVNYPQHPSHPQARHFAVPTSAASGQYSAPPPAAEYQYQRHPQSPPSPPVEEQKPSLPSISSLLGIADGDKAASESAAAGQSPRSQHHSSPQLRQAEQQRSTAAPAHHGQKMPLPAGESRVDQAPSGFGPAANVSNPRMILPPTPPMHPDSVVDGNQSPSAASTQSAASAPYFLGSSLNNMEPHQQRQTVPAPLPVKRQSVQSQPSMSPFNASTYAQSPYASSPGAGSTASYYSPETHAYNQAGMYQQRPLPSSFQPQNMTLPVPTNTANANSNGVWQHHHYISASSQAAFPQSQDRYICSTCNKAFSRPSSLRIHSHSHTGEKPYKCPQPGCGKAFSVRSNMKRHERGCHASASATITTS